METDILTEFQFENVVESKIRAVILMQGNMQEFLSKDILGRSVLGWVEEAVSDFESVKKNIFEKQNIVDVVKPCVKDEDFLIVLFGDTPLISQQTIKDALDYAVTKNLDYCKLPRGVIFKSCALKTGKFEMSSEANFLSKEEFFSVFNFVTLSKARQILKERILEKHLKNGVEIFNFKDCLVECFVKIGKNVKILSGNVLKGETEIGDGTILRENNVIVDSVLGENCDVSGSFLTNAKLKKNTIVEPFNVIKGEKK